METDPGTDFEYCNAKTNILGEIVRRASGSRLDIFSGEHLFTPLGVQDFEWQMMPNDVVFASGDLRLRPRDMSEFGQLFLDMGWWGGQWIVVAPAHRMVVVSTGGDYFQAKPLPIQGILTEYVFPALG